FPLTPPDLHSFPTRRSSDLPSLGNFLSFQLTIDLNYSEMIDFSEDVFVVAGPGARAGISRCFSDLGGASPEQVIQAVARISSEEDRKSTRLNSSHVSISYAV